jgi:hypothetical protein
MARNAGATASESHRFIAKVPALRHRVRPVPAFRKMRVEAATRTFTDIGGSRRAEGKLTRSRPAGAAESARTIPPPILNHRANAQAPIAANTRAPAPLRSLSISAE